MIQTLAMDFKHTLAAGDASIILCIANTQLLYNVFCVPEFSWHCSKDQENNSVFNESANSLCIKEVQRSD